MPNNVKTYDGTGDPKDHLKIFQAAAQVECWAMPTWCHMFNSTLIGATRVWFNKLPPESIDGYKGLKAVFLAYFMQQNNQRRGRGPTSYPLTRTPREIFAAELGKFKPPPPMVTLVEKRSSKKFCEFHNDKGHNTDECVQLRKQIKELVRAVKLSHFIKEIRQDRDQQKTGKKDTPVKGKVVAIYMIQLWQKVMRQKMIQSFARVKEITFPPLTANRGTEDLLVIEAEIGGHAVHRIYVYGGSSMENGIIGRPGIREIQAVPSTAHRMLKFPVNGGIVTIRSTILTPIECATIAATPKDTAKKAEARHENFKVVIHPDFLNQEITIGGTVSTKARTELCTLLKGNLDIFAWKLSDMTGVPRSISEHRLNIREGYPPVRQKKRGQALERAKAIQVEVQKLVETEILREVYYHDWIVTPILEINWKVESLCGYPFKCFLDAYKGYHQIQMAEQDEEKTAFHTSHGVYCYTKMPFGLKNASATYQRLVDKAFDKQIGRNLEIYVDDLVIKSHTETELLRDIEEMFRTLRKINMKLNPKKCTFGAAEGMFLGYMISPEGIKPCPDKTEAVLQLPSPRKIKEVQCLNGKLASLNRFPLQIGRKIFATLQNLEEVHQKSDFHWMPEAE
ncbi:reverse transcriptase domain-containing protein [Tanacetum coccineum]